MRALPLIIAAMIAAFVAGVPGEPVAAAPIPAAYSFPDSELASRQNASALAAFLKTTFNDTDLDLSTHQTSDVPMEVEALGPLPLYATIPTWTSSESWGSSGDSRLTEFYVGDSFVFLIHDLKNSGTRATSVEDLGITTREIATRLGIPLTGSELEVRIESGYVTGPGEFVNLSQVVLYQTVNEWPLGYANRFAVSFREADFQAVTVASTGWLSFAVPQMADPSLARDEALGYASEHFGEELAGYRLGSVSLDYVAWSWTTSRLVYVVWLSYTTAESARSVWVGVDVTDTTVALAGIGTESFYARAPAWVYAVAVSASAFAVAAIILLWRKRRYQSSRAKAEGDAGTPTLPR